MSIVTYNSIRLPYPFMSEFNQEPVYDEESLTDYFVTRFTIRVRCILNTQYLKITTSAGTMSNPAQIMNVVRSMLWQPRKRLSYTVNGVEMIPQAQLTGLNSGSAPIPGTVDSYNGPKPVHVVISSITDNTFILDFKIVAHYWLNNPANGTSTNVQAGAVLFNRWKEIVDIDDCMFSHRTREGYFRIRSDNTDGVIPDNLRNQMAVIAVPPSCLRIRSRYEQEKDGLTLRYRIEDKEVYKLPPGLASTAVGTSGSGTAYRAEGDYMEETEGYKAAYRVGRARVRLWGSRGTSQNALLATAMQICVLKLNGNAGEPILGTAALAGPDALITNTAYYIDMYNNMVEVRLEAYLNYTSLRVAGIAGIAGEPRLCTPGSDLALPDGGAAPGPPFYQSRGTLGILVSAASYYDPNALNAVLVTGTDRSLGNNQTVPNDLAGGALGGTNSPSYQMPGIQPGKAGKTKEP